MSFPTLKDTGNGSRESLEFSFEGEETCTSSKFSKMCLSSSSPRFSYSEIDHPFSSGSNKKSSSITSSTVGCKGYSNQKFQVPSPPKSLGTCLANDRYSISSGASGISLSSPKLRSGKISVGRGNKQQKTTSITPPRNNTPLRCSSSLTGSFRNPYSEQSKPAANISTKSRILRPSSRPTVGFSVTSAQTTSQRQKAKSSTK